MSGEGADRLAVRLLGGVELNVAGAPVELGGAQPRAIIAHLALDAGRVVSVERLIDRLWGDGPPRTPLGTLQSYVSRLRRLIEPRREAGATAQILVSEAPGYRLGIEPSQVDVHRFAAHADTARRRLAEGDPAAALAAADAALALWRGEPLAGIGPDEQVRPIVVSLTEQHDATVELRGEALLALGRHAEAVPALQAAVDEAPLRERRSELLAQALYRSGRQADALRALSAARQRLLDELGLDPGPALRGLERRILDHDPALLHLPTAVAAPPPAVVPDDEVTAPPAPVPTLVGRRREWSQLVTALDAAERGAAQLVLLEGEPGIGKSTLAEALMVHAAERGWRCAIGRCVEAGLAPSLWPAMEIVRDLVAGVAEPPPDAARNPLFRFAVEQEQPTTATTSVELVNQFVELIDTLGTGPLLVVVDDLHWADQSTLDVITVAAQRLATRPVVVVATYRPPDLVPGTLLTDALARFRRLPRLQTVAVAPLDGPEVGELMTLTAGAAPSADVAEQVRARTGGNPLFVSELSRLAGERGVADPARVPEAVRDVVRGRLAQLPERATAELEIAAIVGERFHLRTVIAASDRSADDCLDALDAAIVTRILVPDGGDYRFAHALVRDAVLADLTSVRQLRLHAAVADALEAIHGDGPDAAEPIAFHRLAACSILDPLVVATAAARAADVARWKNALDDGEYLAEQALEALAGATRSLEARRIEAQAIEAIIGVAYRRGGDVPHEELADRVEAIGARSRSQSAAALALFLRFGRVDELPDLRTMVPLMERVEALAARTTEPYALVTIRYMLSAWALMLGHIDVSRREAELGFVASGAVGPDDQPEHIPLVMLPMTTGIAAALAGDAPRARELVQRRMAAWMAQRSQVDTAAAMTVTFASMLIEALLGNGPGALTHARAYAPVGPYGLFPEQDAVVELLGEWAAVHDGGTADLEKARRAMTVIEEGPELVLQPTLHAFLAETLMAGGDPAAVELLALARDEATSRGEVWWLAEIVRLQAEADRRFGDGSRAGPLLAEAEGIAREQGAGHLAERVASTRAELARPATTVRS